MILEPLSKRHKKTDSMHGVGGREQPSDLVSRDEIGSGLQARNGIEERTGPLSQKSHRMRQTDYTRGGFMSNLDIDNATAEMNAAEVIRHKTGITVVNAAEPGAGNKVFRSWSRPQISSDLHEMPSGADGNAGEFGGTAVNANGKVFKTMQVCTCAKFRKRIEPPSAGIAGINISSLDSKSPGHKASSQLD
eukprot:CAMPEP_0170455638 /NCGR_PEP_ID=MMETSP0123-20130129/3536_1 /TAXON_ID=182087 /ORGANISM="Favella ehrenbergii, Strain Fehren 1" /LENGTH=190 /DNA_ID=CAMNT_0010718843 /DNA_START=4076 /DNA_END=4648 /DNA_ORIENTATION=-